jgi:hypothetical protein
VLDTVQVVAKEKAAEKRRRTVPIHGWWREAVRRELGARDQKWLAAEIGATPAEVSKVLSPPGHEHHTPVVELLIAISDLLKLPYPFLSPETEFIALELAKQHRLLKRDAQFDEIAAGVAGNAKHSQTLDLASEHGSRSSKERERSSGTGRSRRRVEPRT